MATKGPSILQGGRKSILQGGRKSILQGGRKSILQGGPINPTRWEKINPTRWASTSYIWSYFTPINSLIDGYGVFNPCKWSSDPTYIWIRGPPCKYNYWILIQLAKFDNILRGIMNILSGKFPKDFTKSQTYTRVERESPRVFQILVLHVL